MFMLILGLALFLGVHSIRIVADGWRSAQIARIGEKGWKAGYSIASLAGFVLIVRGYGIARGGGAWLWVPPAGVRHLSALLTAIAFILIAASHVPANHIKALIGHPMVAGVMAWAVAHLLANGAVHAVVLFGAFFIWSLVDFVVSRARATARPACATRPARHAAMPSRWLAAWRSGRCSRSCCTAG